jgi:hypothetical protein
MIHYKDAMCGDLILTSSYDITEYRQGLILLVTGESARNLVDEMKLEPTFFSKKDYLAYSKNYITRVADLVSKKNPERAETFRSQASTWLKDVLAVFDDYAFFKGNTCPPEDGMLILRVETDYENPPRFFYMKDGLISETA